MPFFRFCVAGFLLALAGAALAQASLPQQGSFIRSPEERTRLEEATRAYRGGELEAARALLERYLGERPDDPQAQFLRGVILVDQGRTEEALAAFTLLSQQYPEFAEPLNNIAVLYAARGELGRAREALERAVAANPTNATARENLGDLYLQLAAEAYAKAATDPKNTTAGTKLAVIREIVVKTGGKK